MTPKEKAEELIKWATIYGASLEVSKLFAIKLIDEILDALNSDLIDYSGLYRYEANEYWQEVKLEIEKI